MQKNLRVHVSCLPDELFLPCSSSHHTRKSADVCRALCLKFRRSFSISEASERPCSHPGSLLRLTKDSGLCFRNVQEVSGVNMSAASVLAHSEAARDTELGPD